MVRATRQGVGALHVAVDFGFQRLRCAWLLSLKSLFSRGLKAQDAEAIFVVTM